VSFRAIKKKGELYDMNVYNKKIIELNSALYSKEYILEQMICSKRFMDERFADKIQINEISRAANLSRFHFIRLFRQHYGVTPNQYLIDKRITEAKKLIKSGKSIGESCTAVGFESVSTFSGLFKKVTGLSPTDYYKKAILKK